LRCHLRPTTGGESAIEKEKRMDYNTVKKGKITSVKRKRVHKELFQFRTMRAHGVISAKALFELTL
jgi:hypothetical protein